MDPKHEIYMRLALQEAEKAGQRGEVPIGAILVSADSRILAATHNQTIALSDPSGHAEILALRESARKNRNYRLPDTTLYVTVEPCVMCMGAILHARVSHVVVGAPDPKWGAAGSLYDFSKDLRFNHHPDLTFGILAEESRRLMRNFFQSRRRESKESRRGSCPAS